MVKYSMASLAGLAVFVSMPATGHHSAAMFAMDKEIELVGTVKQFQYTNPHSWIQVLVPGANGAPVEWSIETQAPIVLLRAGIKPTALVPGDKISIKLHPLKDGAAGGEMVEVKKEDGTIISLRAPAPTN